MPVKPVTNSLHLNIGSSADVQRLLEEGLRIAKMPEGFPYLRIDAARDLEDYFFHLGAVHPEYLIPLRPQLIELTDDEITVFGFTFETWLYVLRGTQDQYVDLLLKKLEQKPKHRIRQMMLAAIGTPYALAALGDLARTNDLARRFERLGFHIPSTDDPAVQRFSYWRNAIKVTPFDGTQAELTREENPVGLPLSSISEDESHHLIRWHYLSLKTAHLSDLPTLGQPYLHLVGPQQLIGWDLYCEPKDSGRYRGIKAYPPEDDTFINLLKQYSNDDGSDLGTAELIPFDDRLIYRNAHILMTPGVVGTAGGPPVGLSEIPKCLSCGMIMFHISIVTSHIRPYSDGFLNLFVCEVCSQIACQSTGWN